MISSCSYRSYVVKSNPDKVKERCVNMSNELPLYAIDKWPITVRIPVSVKVKLDLMASEVRLPPTTLVARAVVEMVKDIPLRAADGKRIRELIEENLRKRNQRKLKKGVC